MKYVTFVSVLLLLVIAGCGQSTNHDSPNTTINVSAAASMTGSLLAVKEAFETDHPEIEITYNFGGSGTLRRQIEQGAPTDLFLSASRKDYEALQDDGKVKQGSAIFENELVVISSDQVAFDSFEAFYESDKKMAIGTPVAVPAGTYAKQVLQKLDVWEEMQDRLILTKDVQQVLTYVNDGVVDAGMVYVSDLSRVENIKTIEIMDASYHSPIEYFVASIQSRDNQNEQKEKAVDVFYNYVQSESSMKLFDRYGFQTTKREKE